MLSRILIYYWQGIFLLTLAKLFEANWQWRGSLMIPLHCLSAKSNNKTRGQFECGMTWFCFCFDFIGSHAREGGAVEGMRSGVRLRVGVEGGREGGRVICVSSLKVCEMCMQEQLKYFFVILLFKFQCRFRQGFSEQQCLLVFIKNWKKKHKRSERSFCCSSNRFIKTIWLNPS